MKGIHQFFEVEPDADYHKIDAFTYLAFQKISGCSMIVFEMLNNRLDRSSVPISFNALVDIFSQFPSGSLLFNALTIRFLTVLGLLLSWDKVLIELSFLIK